MNKTLEKRHVIWHLGASIFFLSKVFSPPAKLRNISMWQKINIILGTTLTIESFWQLFLQQMPFEFAKKNSFLIFENSLVKRMQKLTDEIRRSTRTICTTSTHDTVWNLWKFSHFFYKIFVKATFFLRKVLVNGFHEIFFRWENFLFFHTHCE